MAFLVDRPKDVKEVKLKHVRDGYYKKVMKISIAVAIVSISISLYLGWRLYHVVG